MVTLGKRPYTYSWNTNQISPGIIVKNGLYTFTVTDANGCSNRKDIKVTPALLKENLIFFINSTIINPAFSSQTKDTLTTKIDKFGCHLLYMKACRQGLVLSFHCSCIDTYGIGCCLSNVLAQPWPLCSAEAAPSSWFSTVFRSAV